MDTTQIQTKPSVFLPVLALICSLFSLGMLGFYVFIGKEEKPAEVNKAENEIALLQADFLKLNQNTPQLPEVSVSVGYVLRFDNGVTVYDTGDTGLDLNYDMIKEYYKPDIMITTNSKVYQAGPDEVAWLATKIDPEYILPSHHGSFPFYPKDAKELVAKVAEEKEAGKTRAQAIDTKVGETIELKGLKFTWLGHAAYSIESPNGTKIIIDPEWNGVNSAFPEEYKDTSLKGSFDLILLTHGHFDHYDIPALEKLMKPGAQGRNPVLAAIFELAAYTKQRLPAIAERIAPINLGVWVNKQDIKAAYGIEATHLQDFSFAAVWSSHSSGVAQ